MTDHANSDRDHRDHRDRIDIVSVFRSRLSDRGWDWRDQPGGPVPLVPLAQPGPGPEKNNENRAVPLVPLVPTENVQLAPDLDRFEERAAICENDAGMSRAEAEDMAAQAQGFANAAGLQRAVGALAKL